MGMIRVKTKKTDDKPIQIGAKSTNDNGRTRWRHQPDLLMPAVKAFERQHAPRVNENRRMQRLYYQKPFVAADRTVLADADGAQMYDILRRNGANLTSEVVDAGIALLCRRLQPKILPVGGDHEHQEACRRIGEVVSGVSDAAEWLAEFTEVARAGSVNDIGFALIDLDPIDDEIKCWKLDQDYVFWPLDATRVPQELAIVLAVPRETIRARYVGTTAMPGLPPITDELINAIPTWRPKKVVGVDDLGGSASDVDTCALAIGWVLALGDKHPGRKTVMAGDLLLADAPYLLDIHQVVHFSWKPSAKGFAGVPLTRAVAPYDLTNKRLLARTLAALDGAVPWLLVEEENDIEAVSDVEFQRVTYPRGSQPPTVVVPNPVSTQALDRMEANRSAAFREAHINENAAQGQAPSGIKSAVAQFAWADAVQTVLLPQQEAWQRLWRDAAHVVVALMQTSKAARVRMGDRLEEVELPSISRDKYRITFGLVSGLSLTVSGRLEQLTQIQAALPNKLDNEDVLRHIGLPDTQQLADRLLAPRELAEYIVSEALKHGRVITPPRMLGPDGLAALYRIATQEYCGALKRPRNYYKRDHLEALRKITLICDHLQKAVIAPSPLPLPVPPGGALPIIPPGAGALPPGPVPAPPPGLLVPPPAA